MAHECQHEVDLALIQKSLEENTEATKEILITIKGDNDSPGLVGKQALLQQSMARIWWWLGGISLGGLGLVFYIIKKAI